MDRLFEHRGKPSRDSYNSEKEYNQALKAYQQRKKKDTASVNNKYDNKANKINRKFNAKIAKTKKRQELEMSDNLRMKNANYKYHKDMVDNTSGLEKLYHKYKKWSNGKGSTTRELDDLEAKRKKKLQKNQEKRSKKLSKLNESDIRLECLFQKSLFK